MMEDSNNSLITEGKAKIFKNGHVFYNKVQEFNRDLSVLAVHTFLKHELWKKSKKFSIRDNITILDALSATGLRSIRYSLECQECSLPIKILANDISSKAIETITENIKANNIDNVEVNQDDASMLMYRKRSINERISVIDLDPYGSPSPFLDSAVQSIANGGLLMITCTDMAVLCGNHGETCYAKYGSYPVKSKFCHEMALRILIQSIESHAIRYGRYIVPLLSLSIDFYIRIFVQVFTSPFETRKSSSKVSYLFTCNGCESFELQPLTLQRSNGEKNLHFVPSKILFGNKCELCNHDLQIGGPIWSDHMHNTEFVDLMKTELRTTFNRDDVQQFGTFRRIEGILELVSEELIDVPLYYQFDRLCCLASCRMPPIKIFRSALINGGYRVSYSHAIKNAIKTNAPNKFIWSIMKQFLKTEGITLKETNPVYNIMNKDFQFEICMDLVNEEEPNSKSLHLLRYQPNPEENWGPQSRPTNTIDKKVKNQGKRTLKKNNNEEINNKKIHID